MKFHKDLDVRGSYCPIPILKTKKILSKMSHGEILRIIATDINFFEDIHIFSIQTGNILLKKIKKNNEFIFFIKRK
ncbi:sulfurtransferase TusA family protein [Candidatus Profftella armatura (Diaphorina cf. continua)]|uniref:Sulfurtransferase TusA family protein n=1 Tax=Candidatus Profftella armatura (Diaphorina cf. continua) TaxID=2661583 RepID=A0A7R6VYM9_9PROT|nr:sulfurtransferase TusA family protein [Candidatus Profftella armatura (Diaphorina cf. continua)]BCG49431.1 sulfurtransferase TusA family protein [Candidatus Profftella armatura (Diaphorina cf. continua)]